MSVLLNSSAFLQEGNINKSMKEFCRICPESSSQKGYTRSSVFIQVLVFLQQQCIVNLTGQKPIFFPSSAQLVFLWGDLNTPASTGWNRTTGNVTFEIKWCSDFFFKSINTMSKMDKSYPDVCNILCQSISVQISQTYNLIQLEFGTRMRLELSLNVLF